MPGFAAWDSVPEHQVHPWFGYHSMAGNDGEDAREDAGDAGEDAGISRDGCQGCQE